MIRLGINIDHVATVRQARRELFPDPVAIAHLAVQAGADGITAHLREDRRHIQDQDIKLLKQSLSVPFNMEMAAHPEIIDIACEVGPDWVCLVPERREELTTEGGLNTAGPQAETLSKAVTRLKQKGIQVSLFIDPHEEAVRFSKEAGAHAVELHTGSFARAWSSRKTSEGQEILENELTQLKEAAVQADRFGLLVNAGHGLDYDNVQRVVNLYPFHEFNIGFAIIARSIAVGIERAVHDMKLKLGH